MSPHRPVRPGEISDLIAWAARLSRTGLGSASPAGLPQSVFAGGAARWLGVSVERGQELERVLSKPFDKRKLELTEPIKTLGAFPVTVRLHPGLAVSITVTVTSKQ